MISYLSTLLNENIATAIAYTLIHSLWQAALIALIMSAFLHLYREEDARVRYRISYCALLFVLLGSVITFCIYYATGSQSQSAAAVATTGQFPSGCLPAPITDESNFLSIIINWIQAHPATIAAMWIMGICLFSLKLTGSFLYIKYLKEGHSLDLPDYVNHSVLKITKRLNLTSNIIVAESAKVVTPMLIGYVKPIILFPLGMINQLTMAETEAVLAHELAHVFRNDFLHNLILSVIEMIFYYHPAAWWISANVRSERENCCDDLAVKLTGNKVIYANTLVKLEEIKLNHIPSLAIPMARNKNMLLNRISRIINQPQNKSQIRERLIATVLLFSFFFGFAKSHQPVHEIAMGEEAINFVESIVSDQAPMKTHTMILRPKKSVSPVSYANHNSENKFTIVSQVNDQSKRQRLIIDTIPDQSQSQITIKSQANNQEIELQMENGKIKELKIDGEEIPEDEYEAYIEQFNLDMSELELPKSFQHFNFDTEDFDISELREEMQERFKEFEFGKDHMNSLEDQHRFFFKESDNHNFFDSLDIHGFADIFPDLESLHELGINSKEIDSLLNKMTESNFYLPQSFDFEPRFPGMDHFERRYEYDHSNTLKPIDKISRTLNKDGFLNKEKNNKIELSGKQLKINGEKQASNIHQKYKKLYEAAFGHELSHDSKIKFQVDKMESIMKK